MPIIRFPIVQITGQSTSAALSQKGATDAISVAQTSANEAKTAAANAQTAANNANTNANGRVPNTRKVNNKPLNADIALNSADVGTYPKADIDSKDAANKTLADNAQRTANEAKTAASGAQNTGNGAVTKADEAQKTANEAKTAAATAQTAANNANTNANGRVPNTRKVNGKPLEIDITLTSQDIFKNFISLAEANLNDIKMAGLYGNSANVNATLAKNYPITRAGSLAVTENKANSTGCTQEYTAFDNGEKAIRAWNGSTWSVWDFPYSSNKKPTSEDVGTYPKATIDSKDAANKTLADNAQKTANEAKTAAATAQTAANNANTNANGRVPTARKVNNKPLTGDITITAGDVGAYSKVESDAKYPSMAKQNWVNVTASRSLGVNYTNTTGLPITLSFGISYGGGTERIATITVNGLLIMTKRWSGNYTSQDLVTVIPIGGTYKLTTNQTPYTVMELR